MAKRLIIFIPIEYTSDANQMAAKADSDSGGDKTFGTVKLSADGNEPATHTACNALVGDDPVDWLDGMSPYEYIIASADQAPFPNKIYEVSQGWDWQSAKEDMGLKNIGSDTI